MMELFHHSSVPSATAFVTRNTVLARSASFRGRHPRRPLRRLKGRLAVTPFSCDLVLTLLATMLGLST